MPFVTGRTFDLGDAPNLTPEEAEQKTVLSSSEKESEQSRGYPRDSRAGSCSFPALLLVLSKGVAKAQETACVATGFT